MFALANFAMLFLRDCVCVCVEEKKRAAVAIVGTLVDAFHLCASMCVHVRVEHAFKIRFNVIVILP